ncbi:CGNR zinc finger domain-containing protein [Neorhizobium sp. NCHU2750]|uniref:CGNR zinc finger domain-containing protein n=1 Tax=Neorhizobium sp. NCHU2750 TaxID=1825976 RepID=UPI000E770A14|nr:hypothetical protein NCHU2750_10390 [Neorhizobium sp. NCHU2750]
MTFTWTQHRFAGGALALDVANSVILRFDPARSIDRFADRGQMDAFPKAAEAFSAERALFGSLQPARGENRASFIALREAIDRYFRARVESHEDADDLAGLLEAIAAMLRLGNQASLEMATAHSALRLLSDETAERIRICGNCGWLFIDRSKNRSRIWCDMAICGNRVKAARHYRSGKAKA